jgi:hypothetical protein
VPHPRPKLPATRVPFELLQSGAGLYTFAGVLVMAVAFPPIFLSGDPGASIRRAFLWSAGIGLVLTSIAVVTSSRPQPGGRIPTPPPVPTSVLVAIAIVLLAVLPVQSLAILTGLGEGFFIACLLFWLIDFGRLWRWQRARGPGPGV